MEDILLDFGHPTHLPFGVIVARLLAAALFVLRSASSANGDPIRQGCEPHMLVALASAAFAILGIEIVHSSQFEADASRLDPIRLIEAVTAGVAFLAAGSIIFAQGTVKGLTTGAGLWLAGAIGLASGLGFWQVGAFATLLAILILGLMHFLEKRLGRVDGQDGPPDD